MNRTVVFVWAASPVLVAMATFAVAQSRLPQAQMLSGNDIGFRVEGTDINGNAVTVPGGLRIAYDGSMLVRAEGALEVRGLVEMSFDPRGTVLLEALDGDLVLDGGSVLMGSGALSLLASGDIIQRGVSTINNPNSFSDALDSIDIEAGGSDLAAMATKAEDMGDHWLVDGSKIWTSRGESGAKMGAASWP